MPARRTTATALAAAFLLLTAACGEAGSSGANPPATTAGGTAPAAATCEAVPGDELVVLEDDRGLQTVDNLIPALNAEAASRPGVVEALDVVSAALDTPTLIGLNRAVDVERQTSSDVAQQFVADQGLTAPVTGGSGSLVVGAGNFSESATLAEIYAAVLRTAGYTVEVRTIGNRETYEPELESGELSVVPEYVGTLTEFLNKKLNGADATAVATSDLDATIAALADLGGQVGLAFGAPAAAQDQNAFAVTTGFAEAHDLTTLSDLAAACGGITLGGPPECEERPFCEPGLVDTYGLQVAEFTALDAGGPLTKSALQQGEITLGLVFSSDGQLATSAS